MKSFAEVGESSRNGGGQQRETEERWPGHNVFRFVVSKEEVGRILGFNGETVERIRRETFASVKVFQRKDMPLYDSVVLISGREEPEKEYSSAMLGAIQVFKRITRFSTSEDDCIGSTCNDPLYCCIRLLVHFDHVDYLIGREEEEEEDALKLIMENMHVKVKIFSLDEIMPYYAMEDERAIVISGQTPNVLRAYEFLLGKLRLFLVGKEALLMFERRYYQSTSQVPLSFPRADNSYSIIHSGPSETSVGSEMTLNWNCSASSGQSHSDQTISWPESPIHGQNPGLGQPAPPSIPKIKYTAEVSLVFVQSILGNKGQNIEYIRRTSRATTSLRMSTLSAYTATLQIQGTKSQVQMAQQLVQDFIDCSYLKLGNSQYYGWQLPNTTFQTGLESNGYYEPVSPNTTSRLNLGSNLLSEPGLESNGYYEPRLPDTTFPPNLGSNQYTEWQSPYTTFQQGLEFNNDFESQSSDTTFHRSPSFSWYINENVSNSSEGHTDERGQSERISLTCEETNVEIGTDPESITFHRR